MRSESQRISARERQRVYRAKHPGRCRAASRRWRTENQEENSAIQKKYQSEHQDMYRANYKRWYTKHPETRSRYREKYPEKTTAHSLLQYAVDSGKIIRPDLCSLCGIVCTPHGHHPDYNYPLRVVWVCPQCHSGLHKRIKKVRKP